MMYRRRVTSLLALAYGVSAFLPSQFPPWGASNYNMSLSSISMFCNASGYLNSVPASFGIPSIDWSNSKAQWASARPMDCSERLLTQALAIKAANPLSTPFVYRNLVKALPWFTEVRVKLEDPAYSGFFLHFKPNSTYHVPACDTVYDPPLCSDLYHDQEFVENGLLRECATRASPTETHPTTPPPPSSLPTPPV